MPLEEGPIILYVAALAFLFTVLFELWRRTNNIKRFYKENPLSDRMEKAVHYFREDGKRTQITNDIYQELTGVSDATATRDLQKLVDFGYLEQKGNTKSTYYLFTPKATAHLATHK